MEYTTTEKKALKRSKSRDSSFSMTFFIAMAIYMTIIVVAGFWQTYFGHYLFGQELLENGVVDISWHSHTHVFVFMLWMALLLSQSILVAQNKTPQHIKIGRYGFTLGLLVAISGFIMVYLMIEAWSRLPVINFAFVNISEFAILLGLGFFYRSKPEVHKRYMLFATVALMSAAASRLYFLGRSNTAVILILSAIVPIWIYDLYLDKKIHRATLIGTGIVMMYLYYYIRPLYFNLFY